MHLALTTDYALSIVIRFLIRPPISQSALRRQRPRAIALEILAENLRELAAFSGAATEEDLMRIGWTAEELKDLMPEARAKARAATPSCSAPAA